MPVFEFQCQGCNQNFEQITSRDNADYGRCPTCQSSDRSSRLISRFAVAGQGDLRESTFHGCHDGFTGTDSKPSDTGAHSGHVHGPGCNH
ncbi:MAG: hypothetical protein JNL01_03730 [Bdellovibrionales bacterium]|nr:hypothetical protein [Bdellovibrionales bacterium]MBL8506761.1 hypothetical protein [Methylobacillus glycogenes]